MLTIHSGEPGMNPQVHIHIWKIVVHLLKILEPPSPFGSRSAASSGPRWARRLKGKPALAIWSRLAFRGGQPKAVEK